MGRLFKKGKEKNEQRVLSSVQRGWSIYIGINIVFLLPWTLLLAGNRFFSLNLDVTLPKALEILLVYVVGIPLTTYILSPLPYIHLIILLFLLFREIYFLLKNRNKKAFFIMMIFICLSAAMNLYWVFYRSLHFGMKG